MILVSKTTRELLLHWDSSDYGSPVSVSMDLRMPQFTIEEVIPTKCYERFHLGNYKNIHNALKGGGRGQNCQKMGDVIYERPLKARPTFQRIHYCIFVKISFQ